MNNYVALGKELYLELERLYSIYKDFDYFLSHKKIGSLSILNNFRDIILKLEALIEENEKLLKKFKL